MTGGTWCCGPRRVEVYPGTLALDDVDFAVRRGAVNVLIGENGRAIDGGEDPGGVEQPQAGAWRWTQTSFGLSQLVRLRPKGSASSTRS